MVYINFTFHVILSLVLGFSIGLERQLTGHTAGIRINVLICMGTCFFVQFPLLAGSDQVFRVGSSIISGVGFLCSGVIFKENASVKGINTAATLWCTAAIGILSSTSKYILAIIATAVLITSNLILRPLARKIKPIGLDDETERKYRISITCDERAEWEIRELLININVCKSLFLSNLESGDVVGEKVEVIADFTSTGKPKDNILESYVGKALKNEKVLGAGWRIL